MNALQDTVDRLWKQLAEEEILLEQQKISQQTFWQLDPIGCNKGFCMV